MTLWSGRFSGSLDPQAWQMNTSLPVDQRLARQDVRGSAAWAAALRQAGLLSEAEHAALQDGLGRIDQEFASHAFVFQPADEDIHTAVERRLGELIGSAAGKLHTGRSRNDQVATDFRLWLLDNLPALQAALRRLQQALLTLAEAHTETILPGYTHLQRAQPITLAHWLLSHFWPLERDRQRLQDLRRRTAILPLGCAALAGTGFNINRAALAQALGFEAPAPNSLDAVADRDFAAEFLFCAALSGVHLSKLSEQMVLFTSAEFHFFSLDDAFATGSSLMPQKKNSDLFELARGKSGTLIGLLTGLLATLKGLPSSYDKDLQEDKAPVFAAFDTLIMILPVLAGALETMRIHPPEMAAALDPSMLATDLAEYLVRKGLPFRQAHSAVGRAVKAAAEKNISLNQLSLAELQACGPFEQEVYALFAPLTSIQQRQALGGTAPAAVLEQLRLARACYESS